MRDPQQSTRGDCAVQCVEKVNCNVWVSRRFLLLLSTVQLAVFFFFFFFPVNRSIDFPLSLARAFILHISPFLCLFLSRSLFLPLSSSICKRGKTLRADSKLSNSE